MCGGDIRGIIPHLGARVAHPTWGTGTKTEDSCINQERLGLGDSVQLVISDPLWPTGKYDLSHSLVFCHSLPAKAWLTGLGSFTGRDGGRAEKQEQRRQDLTQLAQFSSAQGLAGRNRSSARTRPGSDSPCFTGGSDRSKELCSRLETLSVQSSPSSCANKQRK